MSGDGTRIALDVIDPIMCDGLRSAAARVDGSTLGRLCANSLSACDGFSATVDGLVSDAPQTIRVYTLNARRSYGGRDKALEAQLEDLDAIEATLESYERQLCVASESVFVNLGWDDVEASMIVVHQLVNEMGTLPCRSIVLPSGVIHAVRGMSHVQSAVGIECSDISHPRYLKREEVNVVSIAARDAEGDSVSGLREEDVMAGFADLALGALVNHVKVVDSAIIVSVSLDADLATSAVKVVTLLVDVGTAHFVIPLQACHPTFAPAVYLSPRVFSFVYSVDAPSLGRILAL